MKLSKNAINEFTEIVRRTTGTVISVEVAERQGLDLLWLLDRISRKKVE